MLYQQLCNPQRKTLSLYDTCTAWVIPEGLGDLQDGREPSEDLRGGGIMVKRDVL